MTPQLHSEKLDELLATIEEDIACGDYDGAVALVARGGQIGLHQAIGLLLGSCCASLRDTTSPVIPLSLSRCLKVLTYFVAGNAKVR